MAQLNTAVKATPVFTEEGAPAAHINHQARLIRLTMANMLWEDNFYVDGKTVAGEIAELVHKVPLQVAANVAREARNNMKLRHVPLLIVREMARHSKLASNPAIVSQTIKDVIQRPDELTEFLAIYWKDGKQPLSKQVKKGLNMAFGKFNEYQLAKYNRDNAIKLRDVLFLSHAKPQDLPLGSYKWDRQARKRYAQLPPNKQVRMVKELRPDGWTDKELLYGRLVHGQLVTPDTWEVELSAGKDKAETFRRLMAENKLGDLAFLRNMRNMVQAGITKQEIELYGEDRNWGRVLPFRFISAARIMPQFEPALESWMFKCLKGAEKLPGKTIMLCDVSSSMSAPLSTKSDLRRVDAMKALAMLLREVCHDVLIIPFAQRPLPTVPLRRGFSLGDAIERGNHDDGTRVGDAVTHAFSLPHDRLIVITDEQSHDRVPQPKNKKSYFINVANNRNGVGYGNWLHIDGFSEAVIDYIQQYERTGS